MKSYIYKIAELNFALTLPSALDVDALLPSMKDFRVGPNDGEMTFNVQCVEHIDIDNSLPSQLLEQTINDMGVVKIERVGESYLFSISHTPVQYTHYLLLDKDLRNIQLQIQWQDSMAGHSLCSLLRIAFAQSVIRYDGVSIHGSVVIKDANAYLFLGKSGTGKSTHSLLWRKTFDGCELLNDDNPTIRIVNNEINIYGTPWSGKTPCYKNKSCRLQGIARLEQAPQNMFIYKSGVEAFIALLPGCAVLRFDNELYNKACDTLFRIAELVNVGYLKCLPDSAAARLCYDSLKDNRIK